LHKNLSKNYIKIFPSIDLTKGYLSVEDKIMIISKYISDVNYNDSTIYQHIIDLDSTIRPMVQIKAEMMKILNPSGAIGGSKRTKEYWINRGWSEDYATEKVSYLQSINSPRSKYYWTSRGYSEDDAISKVSETQTSNAIKLHAKFKESGHTICCWSTKFWVDRGFTLEEAVENVKLYQKNNYLKGKEKYTNTDIKELKILCVEFWKKRYPEDYRKRYEEYLYTRFAESKTFRSGVSDEFCDCLASHYRNNKLYYGEYEFGKYIDDVGYVKYDYVDLTLKVCVEFHGDYWHKHSPYATPEKDLIKQRYIESLGFKYFVVWESDYNKDKQLLIENLVRDINEKNSIN